MTRDFWNVVIIVASAGLGIWLVLAGRVRYLHPENRPPMNPYLRLLWRLGYLKKPNTDELAEAAQLVRLIRGEAVWAMVSGAVLTIVAGAGLIFILLMP
jgi:hypothetical protein